MQKNHQISFVAAPTPDAEQARKILENAYESVPPAAADIIVALGGDGLMLQTIHEFMNSGKKIYGMHRGTVGFLMNQFHVENLHARIEAAKTIMIRPLLVHATNTQNITEEARAFNEVAIWRQTCQASKLRLYIDGVIRMQELICDGIIVATPVGSTAYNLSAHGTIIPVGAPLLALTPVSPFRPRHWRGALLPDSAVINIDILEHQKRQANTAADHNEIRDCTHITIAQDRHSSSIIMFDPDSPWEERILSEQFRCY